MSGFLSSLHRACSSAGVTHTTSNENIGSSESPSLNLQHSQPPQLSAPSTVSSTSKSDEVEDDDDDDDDDGASVTQSIDERAFSVVSFSIHRGHSITSINSVDSADSDDFTATASTIRFNTSKPGIGASGISPHHRSLDSGLGSGVVCRIESKDTKNAKDANGGASRSMKNLQSLTKGIPVVGAKSKKTRWGGLVPSWWSRLAVRRKPGSQEQRTEEVKSPTKVAANISVAESQDRDAYPDGGLKAWIIVFGAMCNTFSTFGYVNSWGIFQAYYQTTLLSNSSPSDIAWIGSIQYSLVFLPGLITGRLFDLGHFHSVFLPCSVLLVLATFLVAECKVYWQFLLCQGFAVGLACGGIFGPTTAIIAHWFKKRRGVAMGLVAVGSSIGGSVLPITAQALISRVGFRWTMRILGLIMIITLGMANLILKRRLPVRKDLPGGLINLSEFKKSAAYSVYCASAFTTFLGIYTVLTYIDVSTEKIPDVSGTQVAYYLVAIANGSSLVGRYAAGVVCDKVGAINVMVPFTAAAGLATLAWPFARSKGAFVGIAIVYGFCSGSYVSLLANPMMDFGDATDVGRRVGMFMSILALGALAGPPISGAINNATGGFEAVGFYAGSMVLVGVVMMLLTKWLTLRQWTGRM